MKVITASIENIDIINQIRWKYNSSFLRTKNNLTLYSRYYITKNFELVGIYTSSIDNDCIFITLEELLDIFPLEQKIHELW